MTTAFKRFLFQAYLHVPLSKYFFLLVRKFYVPPYKVRKWLRFKGTFRLRDGTGNKIRMVNYGNTIENELFWCGLAGWEGTSIGIWKKLSARSKTILDVGANTGLYSLVAGKENPAATIHAFEPLPHIYDRLKVNLELNGTIATLHPVALANENGEMKIFAAKTISGTFDQASLNAGRYVNKKRHEIQIVTRKLETWIEALGITEIDLMKIDVETFEPEVLRGMGPYLGKFAPTMLIEILNEKVAGEIRQLLDGLGYHCFRIGEEKGTLRPSIDLLPEKRGNNFLLIGKDNALHLDIVSSILAK